MIQEAEFQTIASETVHGLAGKMASDTTASTERGTNTNVHFSAIGKAIVISRSCFVVRCVVNHVAYGTVQK